jgi:hypothetical protein
VWRASARSEAMPSPCGRRTTGGGAIPAVARALHEGALRGDGAATNVAGWTRCTRRALAPGDAMRRAPRDKLGGACERVPNSSDAAPTCFCAAQTERPYFRRRIKIWLLLARPSLHRRGWPEVAAPLASGALDDARPTTLGKYSFANRAKCVILQVSYAAPRNCRLAQPAPRRHRRCKRCSGDICPPQPGSQPRTNISAGMAHGPPASRAAGPLRRADA